MAASGNIQVSSSDGSLIQFQAIATYPAGQTPWIGMAGNAYFTTTVGGLNTTANVSFQVGQIPMVDPAATVTFHATSPASGVADVSITVTYSTGGGGGGGSSSITANPTTVVTDNSSGIISTTSVTLSTTSATSISFTLASTQPDTWLTVSTLSTAVVNGITATLTLNLNSTGLTAGMKSTNITVNYGSGASLVIPVQYSVVVSSVITINPSSAIWSGSTVSTTVAVSASTATFSAVVSSTSPWIVLSWTGAPVDFASTALFNIATSGGFVAKYNASGTAPSVGTQGTVTVSDSNLHSTTLTVTYNGTSGGGTGTVTVTPNPATLSAVANSSGSAQTTVTVNSTVSGTMAASLSSLTCTTNCLSAVASTNSITAGTAAGVTIYGTPAGLAVGTYTGTLTVSVTSSGTAYQGVTQVSFSVTSAGGGGGTTSGPYVAPTALAFSVDLNHPAAVSPQVVTIIDPGTYTATVTSGSSWLTVSPASATSGGAATPSYLQVSVTPGSLTAGPYTGTVSIQSPSTTSTVNVTLTVYNAPVIYSVPSGTVNVVENGGNLGFVPGLSISASDSSAMTVTASIPAATTWVQMNQTSGTTPNNSQFPLAFNAGVANLPNGLYTVPITFTSPSAQNSPLTVPLVLSVAGSSATSGILLSQNSLSLYGTLNGYAAATQLGVTATSATAFTAAASVNSGSINWLTVTASGTASSTTSYITVTASPTGLTAGTYYGTITVTGGGSSAQSQITFVVSSIAGGGNVISNFPSLTFTYQFAGTAPGPQTLSISNQTAGTASISFTVQTAVNGNVANWLTAAVNGASGVTVGQTPATVSVSVTPGVLQSGQYTGTVTITPTGGSVLSIPVTLNVQGVPTVAATPFTMSFSYQAGGTTPPTQALQVSGSAVGLTFSAQASTTSGGTWLSVSNSTGQTPSVLSVAVVNLSGLATGTYQGSVVVSGTGGAAGNSTTAVTLTVTAAFPTITLVQSAASLAYGPTAVVSPGELVTLFGTGLGPTAALQTLIDTTTGKVATTLGNVQVLFNGYPAPLTYVSAVQINCVVPYELAQLSSPYVQVKYLGQSSNAYNLTQATTAPGIFTANASGSGQGSILNFDSTYNGTGAGFTPAAAGSVIQVYMTGEGQTAPAGVTGKVTCASGSACTLAQIPLPLLRVAALVNNQPATIAWYGEAPGIVSGVMQVNVKIPPNTPSGPASLVISVGSASSQSGVTIAVR
jgi:uncharacterized protein (TIGR03437 family)